MSAVAGSDPGSRLFRICAAAALALHCGLIYGREGLWGGGDLVPHLQLIGAVGDRFGLYNTYAPAYSMLGALLVPLIGIEYYAKGFALGAAWALIAGFRYFQRAAKLPDVCSAVFVFTPYLLALSVCTPKVEAVGYGLLLFCLGLLWKRRTIAAALVLGGTFYFHTASALLLGLAGGVLCLARGDRRGLVALALGTSLALPLVAAHLAAGCSLAESLMLARGGFSPASGTRVVPPNWPWLVPLANPVLLVAAGFGAAELWQRFRAIGTLCGAIGLLYLNNVWLAPFEIRTLVTLLRGLTMLSIPVALAAGVFAARSPRHTRWVVALAVGAALLAVPTAIPNACFTRRIDPLQAADVTVERCVFVWQQR